MKKFPFDLNTEQLLSYFFPTDHSVEAIKKDLYAEAATVRGLLESKSEDGEKVKDLFLETLNDYLHLNNKLHPNHKTAATIFLQDSANKDIVTWALRKFPPSASDIEKHKKVLTDRGLEEFVPSSSASSVSKGNS